MAFCNTLLCLTFKVSDKSRLNTTTIVILQNCIDPTTLEALRQYFCMIETIPQKTFEEHTIIDKQKQRQAFERNHIDFLDINSDITQCFQWENLDRTDVSSKYDTNETLTNNLIQKEILVDTNNNTKNISAAKKNFKIDC